MKSSFIYDYTLWCNDLFDADFSTRFARVLNHAYILYYFWKKSRAFLQVHIFLTNTKKFDKKGKNHVCALMV